MTITNRQGSIMPTRDRNDRVRGLQTDVLVIGAGPAGAWAALTAAARGARVLMVDKGRCCASGPAALGDLDLWIGDRPAEGWPRAIARRWHCSAGLAKSAWVDAILDETAHALTSLVQRGLLQPDDHGSTLQRARLHGPAYMAFLRAELVRAGVDLLDHHAALELLVDEAGQVAGARGHASMLQVDWTVRAHAVVLASGGCVFDRRSPGCSRNTGDGLLMAAEAGAELSGLEFTSWSVATMLAGECLQQGGQAATGAAHGGTGTSHALLHRWSWARRWARFEDADGRPIDVDDGVVGIARGLLHGPVHVRIIDPRSRRPAYGKRNAVTLLNEGTMGGSGGVRVVDRQCRTTLPGLFVAGDVASREALVGAASGIEGANAAWCIGSGTWAGEAASSHSFARTNAARTSGGLHRIAHEVPALGAGGIGLAPRSTAREIDAATLERTLLREMAPIGPSMFREGRQLDAAIARLDALWSEARLHLHTAPGQARIASREAAAKLAAARWMLRAARARNESRGLHRRVDWPAQDPSQRVSIVIQGVDVPELRREPPAMPGLRCSVRPLHARRRD